MGVAGFSWGDVADGSDRFNGLSGVALDGQGNLYVTDLYDYRVQKLSNTGAE